MSCSSIVAAGCPEQSLLALAPAGIVPSHDWVTFWPAVDGTVIVVPDAAAAPEPGMATSAGTAQAAATPSDRATRKGRGMRNPVGADIGSPCDDVVRARFVTNCPFPVSTRRSDRVLTPRLHGQPSGISSKNHASGGALAPQPTGGTSRRRGPCVRKSRRSSAGNAANGHRQRPPLRGGGRRDTTSGRLDPLLL